MKFQGAILARIGVLTLALTLLATLPAVAQGNSPPSGQGRGSTVSEQGQDNLISGTGLTQAELLSLGYRQEEIAMMREGDSGIQSAADRGGANVEKDKESTKAQQAGTETGGSSWGSWGLLGLLGLFGLMGRGRREVRRPEEVRDIRRVA
jgi:MYXO-CTERM domain-containing protein